MRLPNPSRIRLKPILAISVPIALTGKDRSRVASAARVPDRLEPGASAEAVELGAWSGQRRIAKRIRLTSKALTKASKIHIYKEKS
jgi:hypothetical protein